MLGKRVLVWGPASSGKTTLGLEIARRIGVPHIELDAIFWKPDWVETTLEEFRAVVAAVVRDNPGGWVIDGNYGRIKDLVLPEADTVIWLRFPLRVVFCRALKRAVVRSWTKEPLWGYNYETFRAQFFSRDSLLFYIIRNWRRYVRKCKEELVVIPHHARIIELRSNQQVKEFLDGLNEENSVRNTVLPSE
jgi:adenylate kinase family enzyme